MAIHKKYKRLFISILLVLAYSILLFLFFYSPTGEKGKYIGVSIIFIYSIKFFLISGAAILVARLFKSLRVNYTLLYICLGVFNLAVGFVVVGLYLSGSTDLQWLNQSFLNLLVGFLILADALVLTPSTIDDSSD